MTGDYPIQMVDIDDVHPEGKNPNGMEPGEFRLLVEAIRRVKFLQPILASPRDGGGYNCIDGEHRLRAAKEAGYKRIPAVVGDFDEATRRALKLGMNKLRGRLDLTIAGETIQWLEASGWTSEQTTLTGFSEEEIADLKRAMEHGDEPESGEADVGPPDESLAPPGSFILEVEFVDKTEMQRARRALKKAAGKGGSLADGLIRLIDG